MENVNRKDLMAAGKELNALLEPQPKIKVVGVKTVDLEKSITKAGALIEDGDKLTEPTISVLTALGVELPEGMAQPADEDDALTVEDASGDINDDTDEEPEVDGADATDGDEKTGAGTETTDGEGEAEDDGDVTLQELYALGKDMNEVMGLDPAIGTRGKNKEDLKEEIVNNCYDDEDNCEVYVTDELSDSSWATLKQLNVKPVDPNDKTEPKKGGKKEDKKSSAAEKADNKKASAEKAKAEKAAKAKTKKDAVAKDKGPKKPGVIASIIEIIKDDGPIPKEDILKKMLERFPDRNEKSMKSTINTQVPGRINKERDFTIEDNGKGWLVK